MKTSDPIVKQLLCVVVMERLGANSHEALTFIETVKGSEVWQGMAKKLKVRADVVRNIILAEERAKPAAQRWAEMGDEEVVEMAKRMPPIAGKWETFRVGDTYIRRVYECEDSYRFASNRADMAAADAVLAAAYRLIGGIPDDAAPDAEVR